MIGFGFSFLGFLGAAAGILPDNPLLYFALSLLFLARYYES
jgi:hypothetical protein